jgi:ADP-ribose pyrophosphatase
LVGTTKSYVSELPSSPDGEVLNPGGRTGIKEGRGLLGRPGPNFAADPMIFRLSPETGRLQILLIQRKDTEEWALPGGMSDFGERATKTLQRELGEETGLALAMEDAVVVYQGYVDDPRNTDKAWIETIAAFKLLTSDEALSSNLSAGDDAKSATWCELDHGLLSNLYASHSHFIRLALEQLPVRFGERLIGVSDQINAARTP